MGIGGGGGGGMPNEGGIGGGGGGTDEGFGLGELLICGSTFLTAAAATRAVSSPSVPAPGRWSVTDEATILLGSLILGATEGVLVFAFT